MGAFSVLLSKLLSLFFTRHGPLWITLVLADFGLTADDRSLDTKFFHETDEVGIPHVLLEGGICSWVWHLLAF